MRSHRERLPADPNASWRMLNRRLDDAIPFQWHHHPEFELTLTLNSRGQRFVGDHLGAYDDEDLVLVGPNLPHTWSSSEKIDPARPHIALVVWFRQDWIERLAGGSVEFGNILALVSRARAGLKFSASAAGAIRPDFQALFELAPPERLLALLGILNRLAGDKGACMLSLASAAKAVQQEGRERIDRVLDQVHASYARNVTLEELAGIAGLSVSGLHRMFGKHAHATVSEYLARLRIGDACARLISTDQPIGHIASASGYDSLANFNRQFKRLRATTPREYRAQFRRRAGARAP